MTAGITIVGLGPGSSRDWTQAAAKTLNQAAEVYLRRQDHPSIAEIEAPTISLETESLASIPAPQLAAKLVELGRRPQGVVYAAPGHPPLDEPALPAIRRRAKAEGVPVRIIPGLSLLEPAVTALEWEGVTQWQWVDASALDDCHHPPLEPDRPALITGLSGPAGLESLQKLLRNGYPAGFKAQLVVAPGAAAERVWSCPLEELAAQPVGAQETALLYLPAAPAYCGLSTFQETIAHLRAPEGCPWDRAQTHQSLRPYLLEETYEVLEALDDGDSEALAEELGDLLLQILLHTQIATEAGQFQMGAVIEQINQKLWRRHPHVFGTEAVDSVAEVKSNWEAIKQAEKANKNPGQAEPASALGRPPGAAGPGPGPSHLSTGGAGGV